LAETELQRLADARRAGATLLAVSSAHDDVAELAGLAHDCAVVDSSSNLANPANSANSANSPQDLVFASHVITVSAGTTVLPRRRFALLGR
jgi:hypothetical protein